MPEDFAFDFNSDGSDDTQENTAADNLQALPAEQPGSGSVEADPSVIEHDGADVLEIPNLIPDDILSRIKPVAEVSKYLKGCIYGENGAGKSVLAAGSPGSLFIDCSKVGSDSLINHPETRHVPVLKIQSFNELDDLYWKLKDGARPELETIILDGSDELQNRVLDEQLLSAWQRDHNKNMFLPMQHQYKENTQILRRMLLSYLELDRNVILTCGQTEDRDETDGVSRLMLRPALTPSFAKTVKGLMSFIGHLTTEVDEKTLEVKNRFLQLSPSFRVVAKTRIGGLPGVIVNPTMKMLFDAHAKHLALAGELANG